MTLLATTPLSVALQEGTACAHAHAGQAPFMSVLLEGGLNVAAFAGVGVEESLINYEAGSELAPVDLALSFADAPVVEDPAEDKPADEDKPAAAKPALSSGGLFGGILNALKSLFASLGLKF